MSLRKAMIAALLAAGAAWPAAAQDLSGQEPEVLTRLGACRTVQGDSERLACYDQAVAALEQARSQNQLVVMDRQQIRRARRSIFGLTLPDLDIFGGGDEADEEVSVLETTIRSVSRNGLGKWSFVLEDGARWIQLDSRELPRDPDPGDSIRIRRALMGSFLANVDGQTAIRVRRVN